MLQTIDAEGGPALSPGRTEAVHHRDYQGRGLTGG
jgi:hypothetical protein